MKRVYKNLFFTRELRALLLIKTAKKILYKCQDKCVDEMKIYIIWVHTSSFVSLGISRKKKIGMEAFQNNSTPPTMQEHRCQWRPALCSIFFNSIFFSLLSRSQEIHLIPYVKAEMNEMNKGNASALLGYECNSKHGKVATPCLLYWAYEGAVLCKTGSHISYIWDTSKAGECFLLV